MNIPESFPLKFAVYTRKSYSHDHLKAAVYFANLSEKLECDVEDSISACPTARHNNEYLAIACIFAATGFLEAAINEIFSDSAHDFRTSHHQNPLTFERQLMAKMWDIGIPRTAAYSILEKYQIALTLNNKSLFDKGSSVYQNADLLIKMRNNLIHTEPQNVIWASNLDEKTGTADRINKDSPSKNLTNGLTGKFPESKFMKGFGNSFFPDKYLGYGCAKWTVESTLAFADNFFERIEMKAPYENYRNELKLK